MPYLTLIFSSGDRYDGEFANGKRNGCGTVFFTKHKSTD
ncbi:MAG: hypothetical protein HC769_12690 [Cyanobacteria bacterium CRU_2_1]|nr:hypothetical protein [Cyanobacteria bacterium RU_5_0]NJR59620.1 hypothetical protein [Cyanobacteria bacterium CRU_2_1]